MKVLRNRLLLGALALSVSLSGNSMVSTQSWAQDDVPVVKPVFGETCTQANKDTLTLAHENMVLMLDDALEGVSSEWNSVEYKEAFGEPNNAREFDVLGRLLLMRIGVGTIQVTANCLSKGENETCDKGAWAVVPKQAKDYKDKQYIINFCHSYFGATQELVQRVSLWDKVSMMQGAVFLHEVAHFAWNSKEMLEQAGMNPSDEAHDLEGANDKRYDAKPILRLAKKYPDKAVKNADSYHIFVVKLAMRKGTIYK